MSDFKTYIRKKNRRHGIQLVKTNNIIGLTYPCHPVEEMPVVPVEAFERKLSNARVSIEGSSFFNTLVGILNVGLQHADTALHIFPLASLITIPSGYWNSPKAPEYRDCTHLVRDEN